MEHRKNKVFASVCLVLAFAMALLGATPAHAASGTDPRFCVDDVAACAGDSVDIDINLVNNPGILGMTIEVNYNPCLTLTGITNGEAFKRLEMTKPGKLEPGCRIHWDAADLADSDVKDGVVATLSFVVDEKGSVGESLFVSVSVVDDGGETDAYDRNLSVVDIKAASSSVVVNKYVCPDGHTWGAWETVKVASCTETGVRQRVCAVCGETESEEITPLGHKPLDAVKKSVVAASCEKDGGYDSVVCCERCGIELSREAVVVPKLGHDPSPAVEENRINPTCTDGGSYESVVYCSRCDKELSRSVVTLEAYGHAWDAGEVTAEPTCSKVGIRTYTCELCGLTMTEEIPALDHTAGAETRENEILSTCEAAGHYDIVTRCETCGTELSRTTVQLPLADHSWGAWSRVLEPTYEREGMEIRTCSVCHLSETRAIDKLSESDRFAQTITASDTSVVIGKTVSLGAKTSGDGRLTYKSSNTKVATVSASGVVKGVKAGTATITITAAETGSYEAATKTVTVKVGKANPLKTKAKKAKVTAKLKTVKKKAVTLASNVKITKKGKGALSYANASTNATAKTFKVNAKNGKVTVPKGTKKGTYQVKVKVTAKGDKTYLAGSKTVTFKVVVK